MIFCAHRVNKIEDLKSIPTEYGIEIDIRDNLVMAHDPFETGDSFVDFVEHYNHKFLIINVKSERLEYRIKELLNQKNIVNYFFLDSSFPMIYKLSNEGERNIAIRFSEFESIENLKLMSGKIDWVWVDCFTKLPLDKETYQLIKSMNYKICIVSPELQNQQFKLLEYKNYMRVNQIVPDMICTKIYNIEEWKEK